MRSENMGVGAIFDRGGEHILGAHGGAKLVEGAPNEGAPNRNKLAWLYRKN